MLNIAIVGTGNISHNHIQGYLQFGQRCRIVALVDIYPEKAHEKKTRYGLTQARVYESQTSISSMSAPRRMSTHRSALMHWRPGAMCCVKSRWPPRLRSATR